MNVSVTKISDEAIAIAKFDNSEIRSAYTFNQVIDDLGTFAGTVADTKPEEEKVLYVAMEIIRIYAQNLEEGELRTLLISKAEKS